MEIASTPSVSRNDVLRELAKIPGVYVPSLYEASYLEDGTVSRIEPTVPDVPKIITKRIVAKLPPPPTKFIVPNIDIVHNRVSVEIMRGCTRGCRFCHAGMITRPVRERSVQEVVDAADEAIRNTGFEELALLRAAGPTLEELSWWEQELAELKQEAVALDEESYRILVGEEVGP